MSHLNDLNLHLQGTDKIFRIFHDQVKAFDKKLELLQKQLNKRKITINMQLELIELQESSEKKFCKKSSFRDLPFDKYYSSAPASTYQALCKHASKHGFSFLKY